MNKRTSGWHVALTAFMCLLTPSPVHAQTATYFQSTEFSTVRLSYADLSDLVTRLHGVVAQANLAAMCTSDRGSLTVGDNSRSVELTGDFSLGSFARAPLVAYSMSYSYSCYDAPISRVDLSLGDFSRKLRVSGRSRDQVAALSAMLTDMLKHHESGIGGFGFRVFGAGVLLLVGSAIPLLSSLSSRRAVKVVCGVAGPMVCLSIWIFPWDGWFPGAAFYSGDAAFLVRHNALVTFAGAVLTVVTCAISIWYSRRLAHSAAGSSQSPQSLDATASRKRRR